MGCMWPTNLPTRPEVRVGRELVSRPSSSQGFSGYHSWNFLTASAALSEVFGGVPDFVFFWSLSFPLSSVLELVVVESRVDDFIEFQFVISFYLNRRRGFLYL